MDSHQPHTPDQPEIVQRQLGDTRITPSAARILVALFLASLLCVPLLQITEAPLWNGMDWRPPPFQDTWLQHLLAADRALLRALDQYEQRLARQSMAGSLVRPPLQYLLTRWLGAGNEQVYPGHPGWLFYRPDIDYLSGPGFLADAHLALRRAAAPVWEAPPQPDPRLAILDVKRQLAARNIELILVPTPLKPSVHPEQFAASAPNQHVVQNASYTQFVAAMRRQGVLVFDALGPSLAAAKIQGPQYLRTDTHWRPEAVQRAAQELAAFIDAHIDLPHTRVAGYTRRDTTASQIGDIIPMLDLPPDQGLYTAETVPLAQIRTPTGGLWRADPQADILLLGDSFSNIYSQESMGWGQAAGFSEHLSWALQRPLDRIARNADGAHATRQILAGELARGRDRLAGKRLVIWQFADRELAAGNWKLIEWKMGDPSGRRFFTPPPGQTVLVRGTIRAVAPVPAPNQVPYRDHIVAVHLVDLENGDGTAEEALVYMWGMRDRRWQAAAHYRNGQQIALRLRPWDEVVDQYGGLNRGDLSEDELLFAEPCWGEEVED
ncbi:MAG: hypothetical protein GKR89_17705 [Candidatus Latescibacteria bacterium]|nr:hypothetical protein [Candidatus Latescibacterota bacterium]